MTKIAVVDYGMGNLRSMAQVLMAVAPGADVRISAQADEIHVVDRVILPGQDAVPDYMAAFGQFDLRDAVLETSRSKPMLGVYVDRQVLLRRGTGTRPGQQYTEGLGLIKGDMVRFDLNGKL